MYCMEGGRGRQERYYEEDCDFCFHNATFP
jgi:hypothetical protein